MIQALRKPAVLLCASPSSPSQGDQVCSDIPHTSAHSGIATERREPGLQLGRAGRRPPPLSEHLVCVLNLQESCILANTSFILIFNFIFFGVKKPLLLCKDYAQLSHPTKQERRSVPEGRPQHSPQAQDFRLSPNRGYPRYPWATCFVLLLLSTRGSQTSLHPHCNGPLTAPVWRKSKATPSIRGPGSLLCAPHRLLQSPHQAWEADAVTPFPCQPLKFMWGEARCNIPFY